MASYYEFKNRLISGKLVTALAGNMMAELDTENQKRLSNLPTFWNFYEGFHGESMKDTEKPETTKNFCRRFVDKFVAAEFAGGVSFKFNDGEVEKEVLPFLNTVWGGNMKEALLLDMGQFKSVTGDGFIHVHYEPKYLENGILNPNLNDPFDEYPDGKICLYSVPSSVCFPEYDDGYDFSPFSMKKCTIMYPVQGETAAFATSPIPDVIMKYIYTKDKVEVWRGRDLIGEYKNELGIIPIAHVRNMSLGTSHFGISDLEDLIPLNVELNLKDSDVSEILDYHSAPTTIVYGAKASQLERGANKVWSGLPKDAKVENLELKSDLTASNTYRRDIKVAMNQIKGLPEIALGGENIASNVSGVALQIAFMPLVDTINLKRVQSKEALKFINKLIIKYGIMKGLLSTEHSGKTIYDHEVIFPDILPKDLIQEVELLEREFKIGLESRRGALERLRRSDIEDKLEEIDADKEENPNEYGLNPVVLSPGQQLINVTTGEVIAKVEALPVATPSSGSGEVETKGVGKNKDGQESKTISGLTNKNPGKN